jgi:hypothetical protein
MKVSEFLDLETVLPLFKDNQTNRPVNPKLASEASHWDAECRWLLVVHD